MASSQVLVAEAPPAEPVAEREAGEVREADRLTSASWASGMPRVSRIVMNAPNRNESPMSETKYRHAITTSRRVGLGGEVGTRRTPLL